MKPTYQDIKAAAQYRWPEIHAALGIDQRYLKNKHQPCPACGGKDRFRYDDKDGNGTFICSHYNNGAGDGFGLVMHFFGCDFQTALKQVSGVLGMDNADPLPIPPTRLQAQPRPEKDQIEKLAALWGSTEPIRPDSPVIQYLKSRGLDMAHLPENVRFLPEKDYWTTGENKPLLLGSFPCMVCAIRDMDEELQGLHLTYLQASYDKPCGEDGLHAPRYQKLAIKDPVTGETLPAKKMRNRKQGSISGQAVHLFPIPENGRLVIAEGIETALAARELYKAYDWGLCAALSANSLANFHFLNGIKEIAIIADNDTPRPVGYRAAYDLAMRAIKQGIKASIWQSKTPGYDALDELNEKKQSDNHFGGQTA